MTQGDFFEWTGEWKWTESPSYVSDCNDLHADPGEVDWLRGIIGDSILEAPITGSVPFYEDPDDPAYDPAVRYFRTLDAPGLSELDPKIVVFQVEPPPHDEQPRELTALMLSADPGG